MCLPAKAGKFNTVSSCSKCPSPKGRDRVDSPVSTKVEPTSRRKRTLLSFQGPSLRDGIKKALTRARGLRTYGFPPTEILLRHSIFSRLQGLFHAALSGSRGSVAVCQRASSGFVEPNEAPLAGLED